ncbi:hypothetical protein ABPG74_018923, partial [Tetrahymena malaccensis]
QDSNQKQDFNSSPTIIKNDEMKIANTQNKESSQNVNYLPKQDIEEIQNEQNSQCDQEDLEKNSKSHQVSQMIKKEPENQILNQINLKKEEEDQKIIPISLHSDLTLKKKIQSLFNRNLAKSKLLQNAVIQASNFKEAQYAIITYENKENTICHQYLSTIQNSNVTSKQQKSTFQNSQTQTIRKGTQNIPYLIKHEGEPSKDEQISQKIYDQQHLNDFLIASVQDQAQQENQEMIFDNLFQQNTYKLNQNNQQQFKYGYQSDFSKEQTQVRSNQFDQIQLDISDLKQAQDKTNQLQIEKKLSKSYASQIEKIINQIKELKIDEKELEQQKFENTNENQLLSKTFQDQKAKIFQQLKEKNVQLTKIIVSHDKQTLVLGQKDLDSNQKSDLKISPIIIKEQEKKNFDTLNEENSQEIKQLQKEDIEGIQDKKNYQSNEREFAQITKNHQTSQTIEEESKNQILNQENLSNAKKDREDQNIPIPLHSDLTLKIKIQIDGIITYKNEEKEICLKYQSSASNSKDASKEQIISNQNSQTQSFHKGQQNIPNIMKNEGYASQIEKIINQIKEFKINGNDLDQSKVENINESQIENLDFNQKSNLKISPVIIKQQEKKNFDTLNEGNSQDVQQVSKEEDIEGIQNKEYSQFDEKELTKNYKYQQITNQMIEEVSMYQILNQENISNAKKDGEDQSQQNTPYQMKNERNPSNYEIIQKQGLSNIPQPPNSFKKQQQIFDQNNCLEDQAEQLNDQLGSEKKLSDQLQPDNSALYEDQNKTKQVEIEKQLAITYASQIEKIVNQIKEFKINWNDLDQSKFENINESQIEKRLWSQMINKLQLFVVKNSLLQDQQIKIKFH